MLFGEFEPFWSLGGQRLRPQKSYHKCESRDQTGGGLRAATWKDRQILELVRPRDSRSWNRVATMGVGHHRRVRVE